MEAPEVQGQVQQRDFTDEFRALTLQTGGNAIFAPRPGYGSAGKTVELFANVYPVKFTSKASLNAHQYDVQITPVPRLERTNHAPRPALERGLPIWLCRNVISALPNFNLTLVNPWKTIAYDGRKLLFSPSLLPFGTGSATFSAELESYLYGEIGQPTPEPRKFTVKITHSASIDLSVLARYARDQSLAEHVAIAIQAIDVLLRHDPSHDSAFLISGGGRKFFSRKDPQDLSRGAQLLKGFFQSVRPTSLGLVLNLDTAASPFIGEGDLLAVCKMIVGRGSTPSDRGTRGRGRGSTSGSFVHRSVDTAFSEEELRELSSKLRGARVRVTHRIDRREYIIDGFGEVSNRQMVSIADRSQPRAQRINAVSAAAAAAQGESINVNRAPITSNTMSLDAYFHQRYNHPGRPSRTSNNISYQCIRLKNGTFVPITALQVLPVAISPLRLSSDQSASMIKKTAVPPPQRKKNIDLIRVERDFQTNTRFSEWGIQVSSDMARLTGRLLNPPKVKYNSLSKNPTPIVSSGNWNITDQKFLLPGRRLEHWAVINFSSFLSNPNLTKFLDTFIANATKRGISITNKKPLIVSVNMEKTILQNVKDVCQAVRVRSNPPVAPQILFFIVDDRSIYDELKRVTMTQLPLAIVSQVLMSQKLTVLPGKENQLDQYCSNVAMKLNVKLFGINHNVSPEDTPKLTIKTIMIGADVTHPPATKGSDVPAPSISALVATKDSSNTTYECQVREQEGRKEMITDLESMASILLKKWIANSKNIKPDVILFFRDGVSEGQYAAVVYEEISSLKAAIKAIDPKWTPKISYIVCAKRHNIRFFATGQTKTDKTGNLPAGTVVDTTVVNPYLFDFYLQAHAGLVGTARPTHYVVLLDENGFNADQMQKLVNSLCYTFARATKSVSLVPVAYYADIVATAARSFGSYDDDTSSIASGVAQQDPMRIQRALDKFGASAPMWFM